MFVIYSEYTDKDEVAPHVQEFLGYANSEEEFYEYLKQYKMPDYKVFEEPKPHLSPGSLAFRITNSQSTVQVIAENLEHIEKAKLATFPPQHENSI